MDTTLTIDNDLVTAALAETGETDSRAAVEALLRGAILAKQATRRGPLDGMLELAGTDPLRDDYDYKALRRGGNNDSHN